MRRAGSALLVAFAASCARPEEPASTSFTSPPTTRPEATALSPHPLTEKLALAGAPASSSVSAPPGVSATGVSATGATASPGSAASALASAVPSAGAGAAADASGAVAPACVVPLPNEAPPRAAPAAHCPADPLARAPALPRARVTFVDAPRAPRVDVEVARTADHRQRGLMYRTRLEADAGMLFSWSEPAPRRFWMRNTCIPLDMLFIAPDGTIVGIVEQVPTLNDQSRGVACPAQHVLEVNAGYARAAGIRPGQRIRIEP